MSIVYVELDSCAVYLMTSEAAEMAEKRRYILSAVTWGRRRIAYMYKMPRTSLGFDQPTLAEISLKMSNACVEWDSCAVCLMTSEAAEMAEKRRYILSAVTWGSRRIT